MVRYPNFDLLRLLLALEVALLHFDWQTYGHPDHKYFINPVPAFVAISGFLILGSFDRSRSLRHFAQKRFLRVFPAFLFSFALVGLICGSEWLWPTFLHYLSGGLADIKSANPPLWSLMVEEVLYAILAAGVMLGLYEKRWPIWCWAIAATFALPWLLSAELFTRHGIAWVVAAFPVGSLMYLYRQHLETLPRWLWPALLAVVICMPVTLASPPQMQLWTVIGSFAVVGFGAWGPRLPAPTWDLSYGIYILHFPLLTILGPKAATVGVFLLATAGIASLSWLCIERPALRLKSRIKNPAHGRGQYDIEPVR